MKKILLNLIILLLWQISFAQNSSSLPTTSPCNSLIPVKVFMYIGVFDDTVVHIVWENFNENFVKEVTMESSTDGINYTTRSSAVISSLTDIHSNNYPEWIAYFGKILLSSEHGNNRFIFNDVTGKRDLAATPRWYRVKMLPNSGNTYISQAVNTLPEKALPNLAVQNTNSSGTSSTGNSTGSNLKGGGGGKPGCNPMGVPPAGYNPTSQTQTYTGACCYWVETLYQSNGPVQTSCGGNSYAWCCNTVPEAPSCASGYASDPCCVHYCGQYYLCSCPPWICCTSSTVSQWVVTQSIDLTPITLSANIVPETCIGMHDGSISLTISNATAPVITWSSGGSGTTISNLAGGTYSVTVTDVNNCQATGTYVVNSNPGIVPSAGPDTTICNGGTAVLTASGGATYIWSGGLGTNPTISISPTITTTYTVTVTSNIGCTGTDDVVVNVIVVTANAGTDQIICFGQNANLTAFGGVSYVWSNGSPNQSINVSPPNTTTYIVTVTDANGCTNTDDVKVTVNPLPPANAGPDQAICFGFSTNLNASGGTGYSWSPSTGLDNPAIANPVANPLSTTTYTVTVTDANGCSQTDSMVLTVNPLPIPSAGPDQTICVGQSTNLAASGGVNYVWSPTTALSNPNIGNPIASPVDTTQYTVTVTDANGCTGVDSMILNVNIVPTSDFTVTTPVCVAQSNSTITYTGTGFPTDIYNWNFSGGNIVSGNGQGPYQISWITPATYTISLTVTENGCTSPITTHTVVVGQVTVSLAITDSISCFGVNDGIVTATPSGAPLYQYTWSNAQNTPAATNLSANIPYTVSITDANACTTSQSITLTQPQPLAIALTTQNVSCFSGANGVANAQVTGGTHSYTYGWTPSVAGNVNSVSTLTAGTYTFQITDLHGCTLDTTFTITEPPLLAFTYITDSVNCNGGHDGSICINATGGTVPYSYTWTPVVSNGLCANNLTAGNYSVTVTDFQGCNTSAAITVAQPLPLTLSTSGNVSICDGQSTIISASATGGTGTYTFTWDNNLGNGSSFTVNPTTTTTYTVNVTDIYGCTTKPQSLTVNVSLPVSVVVTANPTSLCLGYSSILTAMASGGNGVYIYTWGQGIGVSSSIVTVTPTTTTTYPITVSDGCGSPVGIDSVQVIVFPLPVVQFTADVLSGCQPLTVNFIDNTTPAIATWLWNFGDSLSGNNTSTLQKPGHLYLQDGIYTVSLSVVTTNGCTGSFTYQDMIKVFPNPVAIFTLNPSIGSTSDPTISFTDHSLLATSWSWDFGDPGSIDNTSMDASPAHNYYNAGTYNIVLFVQSNNGCTDSTSNHIVIKQDFAIFFPSAFTPNDDNKNEGWRPQGFGIDNSYYRLYIYDRWGGIVFKTTDFYQAWDGTMLSTNNPVKQDVYVWIVFVKDINGEKHSYKGKVALIR